ncbi:MAG: tRNA (adenosine(37)-N6)-threonylcarbamoyltransferase complex transferase subunit TsaD [Phycisphaerales bacterium]
MTDGRCVRSSVIASQHELHAEYDGVVPEIAGRAHAERILPVVQAALRESGLGLDDLSAIAVAHRPGLIGSLLVGVGAAKSLAWTLGLPLVAVDHVHAHLYAGLLGDGTSAGVAAEVFPAVGLVVSGGHTSLYLLQSPTQLTLLGATIDDAVGEAYDKVASMLGLPFPGGPEVDRLAQAGDPASVALPISSLGRDSLDFSFSGLKTAVKYAAFGVPRVARRKARTGNGEDPAPPPPLDGCRVADLCAGFQAAAVETLVVKLTRALDLNRGCRTILVGGGVSANSLLRSRLGALAAGRGVRLLLPAMGVCLDNAAMIAGYGHAVLEARGWRGDALWLCASPSTQHLAGAPA